MHGNDNLTQYVHQVMISFFAGAEVCAHVIAHGIYMHN